MTQLKCLLKSRLANVVRCHNIVSFIQRINLSLCHCFLFIAGMRGIRDCGGSTESPIATKPSTKSTSTLSAGVIAAIIMSFLVIIAMTGVMVLILLHCRKTKQLNENDNLSQ